MIRNKWDWRRKWLSTFKWSFVFETKMLPLCSCGAAYFRFVFLFAMPEWWTCSQFTQSQIHFTPSYSSSTETYESFRQAIWLTAIQTAMRRHAFFLSICRVDWSSFFVRKSLWLRHFSITQQSSTRFLRQLSNVYVITYLSVSLSFRFYHIIFNWW